MAEEIKNNKGTADNNQEELVSHGRAWIFDLDQTIVDSDAVKKFRDNKDWGSVKANMDLIKPFNEVISFMKERKDDGDCIEIVTTSPKWYLDELVNKFNIPLTSQPFAYGDSEKHKPDPEAFVKAFDVMQDDALNDYIIFDEVYCVGDSYNDYLCALNMETELKKRDDDSLKKLAVYTIAALWGREKSFRRPPESNKFKYVSAFCEDEGSLSRKFEMIRKWHKGDRKNDIEFLKDDRDIYYLTDYYGVNSIHDEITQDIYQGFKEKKENYYSKKYRNNYSHMVSFATGMLLYENDIPKNRCGVFVVPSSKKGKWSNSICEGIIPLLERKGYRIFSKGLERVTDHPKQAQGGDRSMESNLNTIEAKISYDEIVYGRQEDALSYAIIFDDITTSGSSFAACRKLLAEALDISEEDIFCIAVGKTSGIDPEQKK